MVFNYSAARKAVFLSEERHVSTLPKYVALVALNGMISYALIEVFDHLFRPARVSKQAPCRNASIRHQFSGAARCRVHAPAISPEGELAGNRPRVVLLRSRCSPARGYAAPRAGRSLR